MGTCKKREGVPGFYVIEILTEWRPFGEGAANPVMPGAGELPPSSSTSEFLRWLLHAGALRLLSWTGGPDGARRCNVKRLI